MTERVRLHVLPADEWTEAQKGESLLQAVLDAGFKIETVCGGRGTCHRCQVVAPALEGAPKHQERETFSNDQIAAGYHLACLRKVETDLEVQIVELEDYAEKAFSGMVDWPHIGLAPNVRRDDVRLEPPDLEDQRSDSRRLQEALLDPAHVHLAYEVAQALPETLRTSGWHVSVTVVGDTVIEVERHHLRPPIGVAVDIGTTSVAAMLVNLRTGSTLDVGAHSNSQERYGAEVMSRIEHARTRDGLAALQAAVVGDVNRILEESCGRTAVSPRDIASMTVVGNTTMLHLFLGLTPAHIGEAPFVGVTNDGISVEAGRLGVAIHPRAEVHVLPSVAGFVGADTVGAMLATRLGDSDGTRLLMDIGTNSELALAHHGVLYTASAPAGPAFEGGQIHDGMRAATGAIETVKVDDDGNLSFSTIGGAPPRGLCGSALVDCCAELFRVGLVDGSGRLLDASVRRAPGSAHVDALARRLRTVDGQRELVIADADESATGRAIVLTQRDVRQYQLVKGAIRAGAAILLGDVGLEPAALDEIFLAGSFGSHIDLGSALRTGLVPDVGTDRIHDVGNAALEGARMALLDTQFRDAAASLARRAHHVELSGRNDFNASLLSSLPFAAPRGAYGTRARAAHAVRA